MKTTSKFIICSVILSILYTMNLSGQENTKKTTDNILNVTANEFYSLIKDSVGILIDVRTLEEFDSGYIENAIHVDYYKSNFQVKLDSMDKSVPVFVYCRSGNRSSIAAQIMKSMDFEQIYNLKDGIVGWEQEKLELIK